MVPRSMCKDDEEYLRMLRDDFAAKALVGCLPLVEVFGAELERQGAEKVDMREFIAAMAYGYADAMLKVRMK